MQRRLLSRLHVRRNFLHHIRPSSSSIAARRDPPPPPSLHADEDAPDLNDEDRALVRQYAMRGPSSTVRQITLALAPPERPEVELPPRQLADLDRLYDALLEPLPRVPTQAERLERRRAVVEAADADAFFALPGQDRLDAESWAHRLRCLGAQGDAAAARAAFDEMEVAALSGEGPRPDQACFHALADAHARAADVEGVQSVIKRAQALRLPMNA